MAGGIPRADSWVLHMSQGPTGRLQRTFTLTSRGGGPRPKHPDNRRAGKQARARLSETLESAKATCDTLQERALAGLETTDKLVHEYPYRSAGIAFGVGVLVGVLVTRR